MDTINFVNIFIGAFLIFWILGSYRLIRLYLLQKEIIKLLKEKIELIENKQTKNGQ